LGFKIKVEVIFEIQGKKKLQRNFDEPDCPDSGQNSTVHKITKKIKSKKFYLFLAIQDKILKIKIFSP